MARDELNPNTSLCTGMLKKSLALVLTIGVNNLPHICEGWGTKFCALCPHSDIIPDQCLMIQDKESRILCTSCDLICPCNRTVDYQTIRRQLLRYEQRRLGQAS